MSENDSKFITSLTTVDPEDVGVETAEEAEKFIKDNKMDNAFVIEGKKRYTLDISGMTLIQILRALEARVKEGKDVVGKYRALRTMAEKLPSGSENAIKALDEVFESKVGVPIEDVVASLGMVSNGYEEIICSIDPSAREKIERMKATGKVDTGIGIGFDEKLPSNVIRMPPPSNRKN